MTNCGDPAPTGGAEMARREAFSHAAFPAVARQGGDRHQCPRGAEMGALAEAYALGHWCQSQASFGGIHQKLGYAFPAMRHRHEQFFPLGHE